MSWRIPPWAIGRVSVIVVMLPLPATAVVVITSRSLLRLALFGTPIPPGDLHVGLPLALVLGLPLLPILVQSARVWLGAPSDLGLAFRIAPLVAVVGAAIGLFAGPG